MEEEFGYFPTSVTDVLANAAFAKKLALEETRDLIIAKVTKAVTDMYEPMIKEAAKGCESLDASYLEGYN